MIVTGGTIVTGFMTDTTLGGVTTDTRMIEMARAVFEMEFINNVKKQCRTIGDMTTRSTTERVLYGKTGSRNCIWQRWFCDWIELWRKGKCV